MRDSNLVFLITTYVYTTILLDNIIPLLEFRTLLNVNFTIHADFMSKEIIAAILHRKSVDLNLYRL